MNSHSDTVPTCDANTFQSECEATLEHFAAVIEATLDSLPGAFDVDLEVSAVDELEHTPG